MFFILVLFCLSRYIYWCCVFYPDNFAGVVLSMQVICWCCLVYSGICAGAVLSI
jgi:hypothetical protein